MMENHQYVVWWESSVAGESVESFQHEERAQRRLDELENREYFKSGLVIDMSSGTQTQDEFMQKHHSYHANR